MVIVVLVQVLGYFVQDLLYLPHFLLAVYQIALLVLEQISVLLQHRRNALLYNYMVRNEVLLVCHYL